MNAVLEYRNFQAAGCERDSATRYTPNRKSRPHCMTVLSPIHCVLITLLLHGTPSSIAYTLETSNPVTLRPDGGDGSGMFGYTIEFWQGPDSSNWLLVGAPDWNVTQEEGALFKCSLEASSPQCQTLLVGDAGDKTCLESSCKDMVQSQRLGATLAVHEDIVLVCAPNWLYRTQNLYGKTDSAPVGKCFYSENNGLTEFSDFSAPYDMNLQKAKLYYYNTGYCQAGFSALLLPEKGKVALGSPGCYTWTGDVLVGKPGGDKYVKKGMDYTPSSDLDVPSPSNLVQPFYRYLGYSIAGGIINNKPAVVAGAPKPTTQSFMNTVLNSSVSVMQYLDDDSLNIWQQLYTPLDEEWHFSYCGYSVAVGDLNGDGLDDVAVGCPNYDEDNGAVLIYYQIKEADGTFKMMLEEPHYRNGSEAGARYGTSVTILDDIDDDGYQELAVGAPFSSEGKGSSGRLYIYCSTRGQDLPKTPCQEITAPSADGMQQFGWSAAVLESSLVAVSAPSSDAVLLFKTHPVLQLNVAVEAPNELDVGQKCSLQNGQSTPCVNINVCLGYTIRNGQADQRNRDVVVDIELKTGDTLSFIDGAKNKQVNFTTVAGDTSCEQLMVYDNKKSEDVVEYEIIGRGRFTPAKDDVVVLDERHGMVSRAMLRMKVDCADSTFDTCRPDMRVSIRQDGEFVLGDQDMVQLTITVTVSGDPAYYPRLQLSSGGLMAASGDIKVEGAQEQCSETGTMQDIICSLGGVLQDTTVTVVLQMSGSKKFYENLRYGDDFFTVVASVSCSSSIKEPNFGTDTKKVDIRVEPEKLDLSRFQNPEGLDLSKWTVDSSATSVNKGPTMSHTYEVNNRNMYTLYDTTLTIHWPHEHKDGYMLYVIRPPSIQSNNGTTSLCLAVAGGGFDEEHLYDTNTTHTGISETPSSFPGDQLGSPDILPLTIKCSLGDIAADEIISVEVESIAFYQTFLKLNDDQVNPVKSVAVAAASTAPLNKIFTDATTESIATDVTYPDDDLPMWIWYVLGAVVGLLLIIIMGIIFYKIHIGNSKKKMEKKKSEDVDGRREDGTLDEKEQLDKASSDKTEESGEDTTDQL